MLRAHRSSLLLALGFSLAACTMAAAQGYTTRIETRPFYGATVTIEEGVRVIRPLPVERQVIINPEGQTPLALGFNETNVYERRVVKNYNYTDNRGASAPRYSVGGGYYGYGYGFGGKDRHGGYGKGHGHGHGYGHGHGGRVPGVAR